MNVFIKHKHEGGTSVDDHAAVGLNDHKATGEKLGGIGRTIVFRLWKSGELGSVKIGHRRFSTDRQINEYIAKLENAA